MSSRRPRALTAVFDKSRVNLVLDHFAPNKDIKAAQQSKKCRDFARRVRH